MNIQNRLRNSLNRTESGGTNHIGGLKGSGIAALCALISDPVLIATENEYNAEVLKNDILFYQQFLGEDIVEVLPFPSEIDQSGQVAKVLHNLSIINKIVSYPDALFHPAEPSNISGYVVALKRGQNVERDILCNDFRRLGYKEVPIVGQKGDFSVRNWVMDIFPSTEVYPVRIEFFGDVIESLRCFRIDTQRSVEHIEEVDLYPAKDVIDIEGISSVLDIVQNGRKCYDVESTLQRRGWVGESTVLSFVSGGEGMDVFQSLSGRGILHEEMSSIDNLPDILDNVHEDVLIVLPHSYQAKRLSELFDNKDIYVPVVEPGDLNSHEERIIITVGNLSEGVGMEGILILTQKELFGKDIVLERRVDTGGEKFLDSFEDIAENDFIVHKDHGIGRFRKLSAYDMEGSDIDVAVIEYAEGSTLFVPLYNIWKIEKYRAGEGAVPVLDRIGGRTWKKKKRTVKKKIDTMVKKLLELYAGREVTAGISFSADTELHKEFYSFFPFEETDDQLKAIDQIFSDMESGAVMDRLLCGDVGFGKTEVAMRAAFKALYDGKQVAVVVPTTVLCEQHLRNFRERFAPFPAVIDYISRFKSTSRNKETIERIAQGEVDIVIATHAIFRKDITFSNLGLLIIDEEHRFGVAQKERIKELKKGVDCLMLSATPIPRTLQMAMSGIRTMSMIESPPEERLSVKTMVARFDKHLIREAVHKEMSRNGQVFFVHNRIMDIEKMKGFLQKLLPDVRITCAHGQMKARELEDIMVGFMKHDFDMLICTNIIGSGIDIPRVNTIFVNLADRFGLADLYQLKGRVGRGSAKAFAYFLVDRDGLYTDEGRKRLHAIEQLSYLGAGLKLAMKDLEIRGAGTLFGYKQSGYIQELGFDMYSDMLKKEIERLKGEEVEEKVEPEMDLNLSARIPETYVSEDILRMSLYRRMSFIESSDELRDFRKEMEDRFGKVPEEMERLFSVVSLRIYAKILNVERVTLHNRRLTVSLTSKDMISIDRFMKLAEKFKGIKYLKNGFVMSTQSAEWSDVFKDITSIFDYICKDIN